MKHLHNISRLPQRADGSTVAIVGIISGSVVTIALGIAGKIWLDRNMPDITSTIDRYLPG